MSITIGDLENWFTYHAPNSSQLPKYQAIRDAGKQLALTILQNTPPSADQSDAIRKVREAVMTSNQAIACGAPSGGQSATAGRSTA